MKLTGEQPIEGVVSDRVVIETAKDLSRDIVRIKKFDATDTKNDIPYLLLKQWFKIQETPIPLVHTVVPTFTLLRPWLTCFGNTLDLLNKRFRYFRSSIRIMVKINSIPLDYGVFGLTWYPESHIGTSFNILNADTHLFDVSTGGVHEFVIPYSSVFDGYSIRASDENEYAPEPALWLVNWGCYTLANTFSSSISIECRWDDDFRGWGVSAYDGSSLAVAEGQMMVSPTTVNAVLNTASGAITTLSTIREAASAVSDTYKVIEGGVKWTRENLEMAKGLKDDISGAYEDAFKLYRSVSQPLYDSVDELEHKSVDGSFRNAPTPYAGLTNMAHTPIENFSTTMTRVDNEGLGDDDKFHGLVDMMRIPCVSTWSQFVAGTRGMIAVAPFPGIDFGNGNFSLYGDQLVPDYLAQFSQFFRKWRGSIVYSFLIFTSPMVTGGIDFFLDNLGTEDFPAALGSYPPYLYRKSVMVTGFTRVDICVPFVFHSRWCSMNAEYTVGDGEVRYHQQYIPSRLTVSCNYLTSSAIGTGATPKLFIVVLRSAGPDFQVSNLCGSEFERVSPVVERAVGQMRIRDKPPAFDNICGGIFPPHKLRPVPEDRMTVEDLCRRWSFRNSPTVNSDLNPLFGQDMSSGYVSNGSAWYRVAPLPDYFDYLMGLFRYVRGNIQFKIRNAISVSTGDTEWTMHGMNGYTNGVTAADNGGITSGTVRIVNSMNPVSEFEAPIESYTTDWLITPPQEDFTRGIPESLLMKTSMTPAEVTESKFYVRSGRAFQLAFLSPPLKSWNYIPQTSQLLAT